MDNQTQQRDQDVVAFTAFGGVRNDVTPERFSVTDLAVGDNVNIDKSGRVFRRDGYSSVRAGAAHSLWADDEQQNCLFVSAGSLMRMAPDFSAAALTPMADAFSRVSFSRVNDRIYYSNGLDRGIVENGAARVWGMPVPPLPGVAVTVGAMPAGTYQFTMTWLRADGQESGAALAGTVTVPDGGGLNFALPVPVQADIVGKTVYLTTPNGDTLFEAGAPVAASTTSFYYGNNAGELTTPLATQFLQQPPAGQLLAYYRSRMFVAVEDTLFWSEDFGYELFDLRKYLQLDGRITLLAPMTDKERSDQGMSSGFFIGTERSCGVLVGSDPASFQYVPKVNYGAVLGALDYVDGALFRDGASGARPLPMWMTAQGICVGMPDLEVHNLTRSRYGFSAAGQGAAMFIGGPNRFLVTGNL